MLDSDIIGPLFLILAVSLFYFAVSKRFSGRLLMQYVCLVPPVDNVALRLAPLLLFYCLSI